jgi:hypothetical protein
MPSYLIESYLPRSHAADLSDAVAAVRRAAEELTAEGVLVRHVRSSFLPADELFLQLLEAPSAEAAGEATRRAGIVPERIAEAVPVPTKKGSA